MKSPIMLPITIKVKTGLRIGGTKEGLKIGGVDNPIVRDPMTNKPYLPGSSIKGRMRALLEMSEKYSKYLPRETQRGIGPITNTGCIIPKAFGCASSTERIASRLIFSDCVLSDELLEQDIESIIENKSEVTISRFLKGKGSNPRIIERVVPGVEFKGYITLLPHEGDFAISETDLKDILKEGKQLLEETYLGGYGSRGCGKVEMVIEGL